MPIRTPFSTDVYNGFRKNETSLGEVLGAVQGIQGMVQNSRAQKREEQLTEDDAFINDTYSRNFAGWDGRDPAEFQRRKQAIELEVQKTKPKLFGKTLGLSKTIEDAMYGRIEQGIDLDSNILDNEKKQIDSYSSQLTFNRDFLKDLEYQQGIVGNQFALVAEGKQSYADAVHKIKALGVEANVPTEEQFNQNPGKFYDYLVKQKMQNDEKINSLTMKEKELGIAKSEKELGWFDRLKSAEINQKNRSGAGGGAGGTDTAGVDEGTQIAAWSMAVKLGGGQRSAAKIYPSIISRLKQGYTLDQIADETRFSQQSSEFSGPAREGMQQIYAGKSGKAVDSAFEYFDDILAKGDKKAASDYLRASARKSAPAEMQQQVMGTERALDFINEIEEDLTNFEANGGSTNIFSGKAENVRKKLGYVKDPEMRKIAEKIHTAIMKYRRSMSGAAFSVPESAEYKAIFPSTDKTGALNTSLIDAIKETFSGDVKQFYENTMGTNAYNAFIGGGSDGGGGDEFDNLWKTHGGKE
jgi:hypothetical protein